ncbi:protein phosphatase 1 regulatory subunit 3D-like [Uloborus diversus]|uniref:protein phosphatase 1 regulatory subunit 3D-like n=1 Tax=Uloborus diversus TaxID=327109 RepID=UPI0024099EB2|nr:protein phosphatase 1 regulatory subunit 3D-like [Uloborus diversus]
MSVLTTRPSNFFSSNNRRRQWQIGSQRQHSFSLDFPQNIYDNDKLSRGLDSICFEEPLRSREEDRIFLYLPRNLSYCEVCSDVIRDHVQKKVRLLSNRLCQYDDVPPTPVDNSRVVFDVGEESENENSEDQKSDSPQCDDRRCQSVDRPGRIFPILKKKRRAISFPAPRKEGKKIVRFADALGLELESIRYLVQKDLPKIVPSGTRLDSNSKPKSGGKKIQLVPAFLMPSLSVMFTERLRKLKVSLHSVSTADSTVYGIISVVNITFHKTIFVRYTVNTWVSYHDELATYLDGSSTEDTDKFSFTLFCTPSDLYSQGHSLFFAVCYETADGEAYWDNNGGKNYCIKCEAKEIPVIGNHSWVHFL